MSSQTQPDVQMLNAVAIETVASTGANFIIDVPPPNMSLQTAAETYIRVMVSGLRTAVMEKRNLSNLDIIAHVGAASWLLLHQEAIAKKIVEMVEMKKGIRQISD